VELTFGERVRAAAVQDFKKFWSAYRYWVTFVGMLLAPLLVRAVRQGLSKMTIGDLLLSALFGLCLSLAGTWIIALWKGAESLDAALRNELTKRDTKILSYETAHHKPQRTPAEHHRYKSAQLALDRLGEPALMALRHLSTYGELVFGLTHPPLPEGMNLGEAMNIYLACVGEGLAARRDINANIDTECPSVIFQIAPGMKAALEELLYV
jgi:hypothetical protein